MMTDEQISSLSEADEVNLIIDNCLDELFEKKIHYTYVKAKELSAAKPFIADKAEKRLHYILALVPSIHHYNYGGTTAEHSHKNHIRQHLRQVCLKFSLSKRLKLEASQFDEIIRAFLMHRPRYDANILHWPLSELVKQLEWKYGKNTIPPNEVNYLVELRSALFRLNSILDTSKKLAARIDHLLHKETNPPEKKSRFSESDPFGKSANKLIDRYSKPATDHWEELLFLAANHSGSKPTKKFLGESGLLIEKIGEQKFFTIIEEFFLHIIALKPGQIEKRIEQPGGETYSILVPALISEENSHILTSLVWLCLPRPEKSLAELIARLCVKCFKNIPNRGAALAAVGNACLHVLSAEHSHERLRLLSVLKFQIKQNQTRAKIEDILYAAAVNLKISVEELEEQIVDDCGLHNGTREIIIGKYSANLTVVNHKLEIKWNAGSALVKNIPTRFKTQHDTEFSELREIVRKIRTTLIAQRQRLDQMHRQDRKLSWKYFQEHYMSHGLLNVVAKELLWNIGQEGKTKAYYFNNGKWLTCDGEILNERPELMVSLWHPLFANAAEISRWKKIFLEQKRLQPIKQIYREIYILTDAEKTTATYSNRMAAHILRQHQFSSLAKIRGWKYSLQMSADSGSQKEIATFDYNQNNLRAEFFIRQPDPVAPAYTASGVLTYVGTDLLRFVNTANSQICSLAEIPPLIFSETMRDCDLFVGVATVANDENWEDSGGQPVFRPYWLETSTTALSEIAKTRREVLSHLISSSHLSKVCSIDDRYLVVKGKLHTYKIHIGSTHIYTESGQFICIVPSRLPPEKLFLPFDDDAALSVVISKATLLMNDDQITNNSILRQL